MKRETGFNLIELMVVVTIIGMITSIAVPSYKNSVLKSNRSEGMATLLDLMRAQEDYFINNHTYADELDDLGYDDPLTTESTRYKITIGKCGSDEFTACVELKATAQNGQEDDGTLILDSRGERKRGVDGSWTK